MIEILAIKTAVGKLVIEEGNPAKIDEAMLESRRVFNEVLTKRLDGEKVKDVQSFLANTKQRIIAKAKETFKSFKELEKKGEAEELRIYSRPLPLRMNKRLHAWSFRKLQQFLRYKLRFKREPQASAC